MAFFSGILCMIIGILCISFSFYFQKQEDKNRMPGYYTEGVIVKNKECQSETLEAAREVCVEFTKDFKVLRCTTRFPKKEVENWRVGRKMLIVYDEQKDQVYYNPMRHFRKKQHICMIVGGIVVLVGLQWSMIACGLIM